LKQARNFAIAMQEKPFQVRILVNFEGIKVLENFSPYEALYKEVLSCGADVYFCENAIKAFSISPDILPEQSQTIPSGIVALAQWQEEGFRYVRA